MGQAQSQHFDTAMRGFVRCLCSPRARVVLPWWNSMVPPRRIIGGGFRKHYRGLGFIVSRSWSITLVIRMNPHDLSQQMDVSPHQPPPLPCRKIAVGLSEPTRGLGFFLWLKVQETYVFIGSTPTAFHNKETYTLTNPRPHLVATYLWLTENLPEELCFWPLVVQEKSSNVS